MLAVDGTEFAIGIGPFIPDADAPLLQPFHIGLAAQEPEQLDDDGADVELLGGDKRKALRKIETHRASEHAARASARAVAAIDAVVEDVLEQVVILAHESNPAEVG